jgi:glyoxylase-like metal-dependent hydrolase (beta-lactamase superfamily II)
LERVDNHTPVDLLHQGIEHVIGCYRLETEDGPALQDCGPPKTFERLREQVDLGEIRHLLLSHIHLDHAGAAGHIVRENPEIQVHVHEIGVPHVIDPQKLLRSARRLYGDDLDRLFGEPLPVPAENVHVVDEHVIGLGCFPTPGHAGHHVCYMHEDGTLYAGDALGVRIVPERDVLPHCPPPEVDLEAWEQTFDDILRHQPTRIALIHFGEVHGTEEVADHVVHARDRLREWAERVRNGMSQEEFVAKAVEELEGDYEPLHELADPFEHCWLGLKRYWDTHQEQ